MNPRAQETILFISPNNSSFVRQDAELLAQHFEVQHFQFGSQKAFQMVVFQLKLLFWLLRRLRRARCVYIWFGDYHSFLPTLLGKVFGRATLLVIGGYDAAKLPEYNYGGHNKKLRSWIIKKSCDWATRLLPVSEFVSTELSFSIGGKTEAKREVVYNGVDVQVFPNEGKPSTRAGAICVALADSHSRVMIKGLDRFAMMARRFPEEPFTLVGVSGMAKEWLEQLAISNLTLLGPVSRTDLQALYRGAKVVCQLSRFESFGMALAEGMLCGCIPVTMAWIGAAEVVAPDSGYLATSNDEDGIAEPMALAFAADEAMGARARQHILDSFSLEIRGQKLLEIIARC